MGIRLRHDASDDDRQIPLKERLVIVDDCLRHRATLSIERHVAVETILAARTCITFTNFAPSASHRSLSLTCKMSYSVPTAWLSYYLPQSFLLSSIIALTSYKQSLVKQNAHKNLWEITRDTIKHLFHSSWGGVSISTSTSHQLLSAIVSQRSPTTIPMARPYEIITLTVDDAPDETKLPEKHNDQA